jgi:hypothetical protein
MDGDPNFRLKAFAVIACVLGVFFVAFVAQRTWFWIKSRRREDVETSRLAPVIDFSLLALGAFVIWMAIEALVLAVIMSAYPVQAEGKLKVAEIEVGKLDQQTGQLNLVFYPVDRAGRRLPDQRHTVLTSGEAFELRVDTLQWRGMWTWLGEGGFYQFVSLGGRDARGVRDPSTTSLGAEDVPNTMGRMVFLRPPEQAKIEQSCKQGDIYDIYLGSGSVLEVELRQIE